MVRHALSKEYELTADLTDPAPIQHIPLDFLEMGQASVKDISALKGMPLKKLSITIRSDRDIELLRSNKTLENINGKPVAEFWREVEEQQKKKQPLPADRVAVLDRAWLGHHRHERR